MKWLRIHTTDRAHGNDLAGRFGQESGDTTAFDGDKPTKTYPAGTTFSPTTDWHPGLPRTQADAPASGWYLSTQVRTSVAAAVDEFNGAGPYPILNSVGLTNARIAELKATTTIAVYDGVPGTDWRDWLAAIGRVAAP